MTPEEEIQRAGEANSILKNPVFKDAVSQVEEAILFGIRKAAISDTALREKLSVRYAVLHDLLDRLKSTMETGKMAEVTLAQRIKNLVR